MSRRHKRNKSRRRVPYDRTTNKKQFITNTNDNKIKTLQMRNRIVINRNKRISNIIKSNIQKPLQYYWKHPETGQTGDIFVNSGELSNVLPLPVAWCPNYTCDSGEWIAPCLAPLDGEPGQGGCCCYGSVAGPSERGAR